MSAPSEKLYPNCNTSVWLRSCEEEVMQPLSAKTVTGTIPSWLRGCLLRNGPGSLKVGSMRFEHLFDSSALVHRFSILDGAVTYQCRFIQTNTFVRNHAAKRIVVSEFGTKAVPDPCHTIFDRVASIFKPAEAMSDNTMISLYPFGDELYSFTEGPFIHRDRECICKYDSPTQITDQRFQCFESMLGSHNQTTYHIKLSAGEAILSPVYAGHIQRLPLGFIEGHGKAQLEKIDPKTLDTLERKDMMKCVALVNHTSHPHIMGNGMANLIRDDSDVVGCVRLYSVTETSSRDPKLVVMQYLLDMMVFVGDVINVGMSVVKGRISHVVVKFPYTEKGDMFEQAHIVGSMKPSWSLHPAYMHTFGVTENYFVIIEQPLAVSLCGVVCNHFTNKPLASSLQWYPEQETNIVLICKTNGKEVKRYQTETLFFLHIINTFEQDGKLIVDLCAYKDAKALDAMYVKAIENMQSNADYAEWFRGRPKRLEVALDAPAMSKVEPRLLADIGCETPRIHYDLYNGRPYRYFYAISSDVDAENPGSIIKVDTWSGETKTWFDTDCYPSEPVFVPEPDSKEEDAGILLSALVWGSRECSVGLIVLDARMLTELARVVFDTPSPAPKCLHGWFLPHRV